MKKEKKYLYIFIVIICCVSLIPTIYRNFSSIPYSDDFEYSFLTSSLASSPNWNILDLLKKGFETDLYYYNHWQGLYSSAFILSLQPGIFGEQYYFIGAIILMVFGYLSILYFIKTIKKYIKVSIPTSILSIILFTIILQGMPDIQQGLFWFNGAWNYSSFFFLLLINISLLLNILLSAGRNNNIFYALCSSIISIVISGGNHVTAFLNILIEVIMLVYAYKKNKIIYLIFPLLLSVAGFIVVLIAPGTAIRQEQFVSRSFFETIIFSAIKCYEYLCEWINIQTVSYYILLYFVAKNIKENNPSLIPSKNPIIVILIMLVLICGMLCVPWKAMGGFGEGRLTNVIWFAFIIMSGITLIYSLLWISNKIDIFVYKSIFINIIIISLILMVSLYAQSNGVIILREMMMELF